MPRRLLKVSEGFLRRLHRVRREPLVPAVLLIIAGGLWGFLEIAGEFGERGTREIDRAILLSMRVADDPADPVGPVWLEGAARDVTALGGYVVLAGLTLASVGIVLLLRRPRLAGLILAATVGGWALGNTLKRGYDRPRPDLVQHHADVTSASFPSGHAMMSAVVYLTLGLLLARALPGRWLKVYLVALAVFLALAIGISRVYLGVHWPTDVIAGWALGSAWALLFWLVALRIDPRKVPVLEHGRN
ncbi:MAG: phosphatase PAP2 family protein [Verrucomicrobiales bacterium]